ncbi:7006_t:CDS:10 [Ambispora gerdemannii]|uniref:Flap endonuclease 1 n=1 Tax=Ambispora gerdemannii TaxID=144530 RepID=A0A9N8ZY13_9GLOM|nr:7006_t:CDS:10 [Ambispora gerdemannii]
MGIHGLHKLIGDNAPHAIKANDIKTYFGRKVAIDASMSLYQFLIAVRSEGQQLMNEAGETTSHLMGMFYRTIRMVENGIKPCYVFDGKPPTLKSGELAKRLERRKEANKNLEEAQEAGNSVDIDKFTRRMVKVTPQHNSECKKLLQLMGIPVVEAPCEAEAQCAALAREGKVFAAASEDMDTLTFGAPILLRHLTFSEAKKLPINEMHLSKVREELGLTMEEFIDLCILLGCDYCESIKGIGPHRALELIKKYRSLEEIIKNIDTKKYPIPENWPYKDARQLFLNPEVENPKEIELKWESPNVEAIVNYLVHDKGFNEERVRKGTDKLVKHFKVAVQGRLDGFFTTISTSNIPSKRKAEDDKKEATKSKKTKTAETKSSGAKKGRPKK